MPQISIITSVYNTPVNFLRDYVNSILGQTFQDFEIVIVDDASTSKDTLQCLKGIQSNKIHVIFQDINQGISASRTLALSYAKGEYVCIVDSDDYLEKDFLSKLIKAFRKDSHVDMAITLGYKCIDIDGKPRGVVPHVSYRDIYSHLQKPSNCRLIRRSLLTNNKIIWPEGKIYEDNVFCLFCVLCASRIVDLDFYGYINRQHKQSYSHGSLYKTIGIENIPYDYIEEYICKNPLMKECEKEKRTGILGEALAILATCEIFFCRCSQKEIKRKVIEKNRKFIKSNINRYIYQGFMWGIKSHYSSLSKVLFIGLYVSIFIHLDYIYVKIVHKLLNLCDKEK